MVAGPDRLTACDISGTDAARDRLEALGHHPRIIEAAATSWRCQRQFDKITFSFGLPYVTDSMTYRPRISDRRPHAPMRAPPGKGQAGPRAGVCQWGVGR